MTSSDGANKIHIFWVKNPGIAIATLAFTLMHGILLFAQSNQAKEQQIPGTLLKVKVPDGWHVETVSSNSGIVHDTEPRYFLIVTTVNDSDSCSHRFREREEWLRIRPKSSNTLPTMFGPPPSFVPNQYAPLAAFIGNVVVTCIDLGTTGVSVAFPMLGDNRDRQLIPPLDAIAQAALMHTDYASAGGLATFPSLGVKIRINSGRYIVKPFTINGKPRDTIVRLNSLVPLRISFIELRPSGEGGCAELFSPEYRFGVRENPPFVSKRWYQRASTWQGQREYGVCYAASPQLLLVAQIDYGASEIGEEDANLIKEILDSVAELVGEGPHITDQITETVSEFYNQSRMGGVVGAIALAGNVNPKSSGGDNKNPQLIRIPEFLSSGLLLTKVEPEYPTLVRQAQVQGTVRLQVQISVTGIVESAKLISGPAILAPAAIKAVKQWVYKPYLFNHVPVAVETEVAINFALSKNAPGSDSRGGRRPKE